MKTINTIYFSPTHTSEIVANSVASGFVSSISKSENPETKKIALTRDDSMDEIIFETDDIVVIAAPVYAGRIAPLALQRFERLKGNSTPAILLVVYGNRDFDDALLELSDFMEIRGFLPFAAAAFIGEHSYSRKNMPIAEGRPDMEDIAAARKFGEQAYRKYESLSDFHVDLEISGNRPYKFVARPSLQTPVWIKEKCVNCKMCLVVCPTSSIYVKDGAVVFNAETCIKCCACTRECAMEALVFDTPYTEKLHIMCSERKEATYFI